MADFGVGRSRSLSLIKPVSSSLLCRKRFFARSAAVRWGRVLLFLLALQSLSEVEALFSTSDMFLILFAARAAHLRSVFFRVP